MMAEQWFEEKFANLQIDGNSRLDGLSQIHEKLQGLNPDEIANVITHSQVQLSTVFACVEKVSRYNRRNPPPYHPCSHTAPFSLPPSQQTTVACDILSLCLSSLDLNSDKDDNVLLIDDMIRHPNESVKLIGLTQLERLVRKEPEQTRSPSLVAEVIRCLEPPSTSIGSLAVKILSQLLPRHFDAPEVSAAIEAAAGCSSSVAKCRVYDVVVTFSCNSPQNMRRVEKILERIIADLSSDDLLLQLSVMEILSQLVVKDYGLAYLEEQGLFPRLMAALENIDMMHILFPGFIKFFGSVANAHPDKIFTKFSHICRPLFETIISNDSSTLSPCLETLGVLGRSRHGKIGLSGLSLVCPEGDMKMVLMEMSMFLSTLPTEEQIRILNCLELLFRLEAEGGDDADDVGDANASPDNRVCLITETWYKFLDRGPGLKILMAYLRNPFPDIKLAGFGVLKSIVGYPWGQAAVADTAGLLEYILDRGADFNTEAFQAKFEILLVLNRFNGDFSEAQQKEIKDYVAKGPFYKKGITEVAIENHQ